MSASCEKRRFRFGVFLCALLVPLAVARAGPDVLVDGAPGSIQNETALTVVPSDPNFLAVAYNDFPFTGPLGIAWSGDRGLSWNTTQLPIPFEPTGVFLMAREFDPTITADANGVLFAACIADGAIGSPNPLGGVDNGLYVFRSTDFGQNWGLPYTVSYDSATTVPFGEDPNYRYNDRCRILADVRASSPYQNNLYVTWIKDRGLQDRTIPGRRPQGDIYFARSTDGGANFSTPVTINDPNNDMATIPIPTVTANGNLYVAWLDYNVWTVGTGQIYLRKSTDGGATFPAWDANYADHPVATINLPPFNLTDTAGNWTTITKANSGTPIAGSPTDANLLYIAYAADPDGPGPDESDIYLIRSADAGENWSGPLRVNDDLATNDQCFPWLAVKSDGTIDIAWYDRRNDANDSLWDVYIAKSTDGGATFSANVRVSDVSATTASGYGWMGEYLGLAVDGNDAFVAFTSSRSDLMGDIWFDSIANADIPEPGSCALVALGALAILRRRRRAARG